MFPYQPVKIDAPLLPPMTELLGGKDGAGVEYTWAQARDYLQIHHALQEIIRTHAEIASANAENLANWLLDKDVKGRRDDCGECPLANYYLRVTQVALAGMTYRLEVEVRGTETMITIHPHYTGGPVMGLVRIELPNSPTHVEFIKNFDYGHLPALDEAPDERAPFDPVPDEDDDLYDTDFAREEEEWNVRSTF
jgi:hypothetical protein